MLGDVRPSGSRLAPGSFLQSPDLSGSQTFLKGRTSMKALQKHLLWTLALAVGSSTVGVMQATAQDRDHDRDHNQYQTYNNQWNNRAYQEGVRQGQDDRAHNRGQHYRGRYDNDRDRAAYEAGYDQAY